MKKKLILILFTLIAAMLAIGQNSDNPFIDKLGKPKLNSGFKREGYSIWGSSVIKGDDGKYHMFVSCWENNNPRTSWITNSTILHAVCDTPEGTFQYVGEALPPRGEGYWDGGSTYNPTIHKHGNTYILFYTATHYKHDSDFNNCKYEALVNKRIGIAISKSLYGPWKRYEKPILEPRKGKWDAIITSNAAPYVNDDGSVLLVYKSWTRHATDYYADRKTGEINQLLGVAGADHYLGEYKRLKETRLFDEATVSFNSEDSFIWKQDGQYHMLAKIFEVGEQLIGESSGGYHATSEDGVNWEIDNSGAAWSRMVEWAEGGSENFLRVERPQLLIQNGVPTHIYFACRYKDQTKDSHSICLPILKK